jgi:hypothetical protein
MNQWKKDVTFLPNSREIIQIWYLTILLRFLQFQRERIIIIVVWSTGFLHFSAKLQYTKKRLPINNYLMSSGMYVFHCVWLFIFRENNAITKKQWNISIDRFLISAV